MITEASSNLLPPPATLARCQDLDLSKSDADRLARILGVPVPVVYSGGLYWLADDLSMYAGCPVVYVAEVR